LLSTQNRWDCRRPADERGIPAAGKSARNGRCPSTERTQHELHERLRRLHGTRRFLAIDVAKRDRLNSGNQRKYSQFIRWTGDVAARVGTGEPFQQERRKALDDRLATDFVLRPERPHFHEKDAREVFVSGDHRQNRVDARSNLLHRARRRRGNRALNRLKKQPTGFSVERQHRRREVVEVLVEGPPPDAGEVNHVLDRRL